MNSDTQMVASKASIGFDWIGLGGICYGWPFL